MTSATAPGRAPATPGPMIVDRPEGRNAVVKLFVFVPFLALVAAVPFAWGWGLSWIDIGLATFFYFFACAGVTVGFHRLGARRLHPGTPFVEALAAHAKDPTGHRDVKPSAASSRTSG